MYERLMELLKEISFNKSTSTQKGTGTISCYHIPEDTVEEIKKLLGVIIDESSWSSCENFGVHIEVFVPEQGRPTAQLYGIPQNQTDFPILYISTEVVLS